MEGIVRDGHVTRGWIGVEPNELSPELAETFGVKPARDGDKESLQGVIITGVLQSGPAAQGGIKPGDVIQRVGEKNVNNVSELLAGVAGLRPGVPANFNVLRRGEALELRVTPGVRPRPKPAPR